MSCLLPNQQDLLQTPDVPYPLFVKCSFLPLGLLLLDPLLLKKLSSLWRHLVLQLHGFKLLLSPSLHLLVFVWGGVKTVIKRMENCIGIKNINFGFIHTKNCILSTFPKFCKKNHRHITRVGFEPMTLGILGTRGSLNPMFKHIYCFSTVSTHIHRCVYYIVFLTFWENNCRPLIYFVNIIARGIQV